LFSAATIVRVEGGSGSSEYDYDIITIGAGSGGVRASRFATSYGELAANAMAKHCQKYAVSIVCSSIVAHTQRLCWLDM
jgi:hypothetical protein